ncbi:DEAD/DEAH box helicase [Paractinoplanes rishiriensis]|uniref:Helicase n=1 Tax=Paractinoplanes rishiriensis TaxID=1050105 RepID=A0A919JY42_9ACTN|nr:DEAD/DEAH box helicase [Actinoplanes rishiriensis]GIE95804.1 helicase [Actinoplanes rishiriensis]
MTELLPTVQAANVRASLVDYLTTTFALTETDPRDGLDTFLSDPVTGMFKGPYVRLRLPFRPAEPGWRQHLDWYAGPPPYGHQAAAFARLTSLGGQRPQPTLVTTGTGSGKTEAFLYPVLDHVRRARLEGVTGIKALILYPMNALANDQAARLAGLLTGHPELASITAALYTGQKDQPRTMVTADGLITDRGVIRDTAPDILLTNYKMLDQLLLRHDDQSLWRQSATSLRYLVLDEFHTYDGAQGTDVAMLLRRLGLALKSHWRDDDPEVTDEARARPLGLIAPVATSATLGDKGDPASMLGFAETVFGERFSADALVTESRQDLAEWVGDAETVVAEAGFAVADEFRASEVRAAVDDLGTDPDGAVLAHTVLGLLWAGDRDRLAEAGPDLLLALAKAHPLVQELAFETVDAISVDDLVRRIAGQAERRTSSLAAGGFDDDWAGAITAVVAALGHIRAVVGRDALAVDVHLWVRELTRIDRAADTTARFRWGDDGPPVAGGDTEDVRPSFPAVYCRFCGRSGWGVALAPVGTGLAVDDETIRRNHANQEGRFRALLYAPAEADAAYGGTAVPEGLAWFSVRGRELLAAPPGDDDPDLRDGWILPVLTSAGRDADEQARHDTCPSCAQPDGIRFLGSAIATLLSVSLSTLFGSAALDLREKKALVFTDSVQDAAHRAGFVEARSHTLTLRAALNAAIAPGALTLDALVEDVIQRTGTDHFQRYRLLGPDCVDRESFTPFWTSKTLRGVPARVMSRVRKRLALDVALEFGLNSRTGRTLELTGAATVEVDAGPPARMAAAARSVLTGFAVQSPLDAELTEPTDEQLVQWVRGVLDRMRAQGAIDHPWFTKFRQEDGNRWSIWGGRPRSDGMPAFPNTRPAPSYPRVGGSANSVRDSDLDAVTSAQSWYARWTSRALSASPADGGRLTRLLLDRLARDGVLSTVTSQSGATVYAIPPSGVQVAPTRHADLAAKRHLLACDTCRAVVPGSRTAVDQLDGAPCMLVRCHGRLTRETLADNFYRRLYASPDMRRIVAREHTSLLDDATRLSYEDGFKKSSTEPQAPNVLVATPTLEMGIDIGDLSTVLLSSLPRTVASYLQRVGRAGRLTGNALNLAYLTGRGDQLPKLGDPLSVINGEVRPPATYLSAEEILRRQFTACLIDGMARDERHTHPASAQKAIGASDPGSFLGELIAVAETGGPVVVRRFTDTITSLPEPTVTALSDWVRPSVGAGTSLFAGYVHAASQRWQQTVETLKQRQADINKVLPELEAKFASPAKTDDDKRALRSANTTRKLVSGQLAHLRGEYWISVLEEYGLLPNYTLLDDTVTLAVGISWTNPDSGEFESDSAQFRRGSAQAIREFAPGATFYARGWEIAVDAIDLGIDGESIRPWAFCPACGFAADIAATGQEQPIAKCPRCGSTGIADTGQRLDVVELSHVSAEVRRDEVKISDRRDQRDRIPFQLITAPDIDPAGIAAKWYADNTGLGCTYLRSMDLRWLNVGVPGHGTSRIISADERTGTLFRVCSGCGKLDTDSGRNRPHEHRAWCPYRKADTENTVVVALSRTLHTQGLLLRLPYAVTLGDDFAVPSLAAAVLLGLREQIGGHPDHLRIEHVVEPTLSDGTDNHDALLLHDVVPGGTGYLADLSDPGRLRDLLAVAWQRVHDCECRHEERLACHRCLLPFTPPAMLRRTSRASAERHLAHLLGLNEEAETADGPPWTLVTTPPQDSPESHLEQRFRKLVTARLAAIGAAMTEVPKPWGNALRFTLPGDHRQWTLTPQVNVENSRPDFLLESNDTSVPAVAVFTDGHAFHAVPSRNRLAEDAEKRQILRDTGRIVLAVTAADIAAAEQQTPTTPAWFAEATVAKLIKQAPFQTAPSAYERLRGGPISWLLSWVSAPRPAEIGIVARAVPMFLVDSQSRRTCADGISLAAVGRAVLLGEELSPGTRTVLARKFGAVAIVVEPTKSALPAAVVLDDRDQALDATHADAWRLWLQLANAMSLRDWPTVITTASRVGSPAAEVAAPEPAASDSLPDGVDESWASAYESAASGVERDLIRLLAAHGELKAPLIGAEGPDGIPMDICWPNLQVAVDLYDMPDQDRADLHSAGWQVVKPEPEAIIAALSGTTDLGER